MPKTRHVLIAVAAGLSLSLLPIHFASSPLGSGVAYAKNGSDGGGNGNGGGNGGGNGNGGGKDAGSGGSKSSASAESRGSAKGSSAREGGFLKSMFGGKSEKTATKSSTKAGKTKSAAAKTKSSKKTSEVAALPENVDVPTKKPAKTKGLDAKLGGLHSLNRNINAYINSNSPRMAGVQAYVEDLVALEEAKAAAEDASADVEAAQKKLDELEARQQELSDLEAGLVEPDPTDVEAYEAYLAEKQAIDAEQAELETAIPAAGEELKDAEAAAEKAAQDLAEAEEAVDDDALKAALETAANPNRVVDTEVMEWARPVLAEKAVELKQIMDEEDTDQETVETDPETVESDPELVETEPVIVEPAI